MWSQPSLKATAGKRTDGLHTKKWLIFTLTTSLALFLSSITLNNTTLASTAASTTVEDTSIVKAQSVEMLPVLSEAQPMETTQDSIVSIEQYVKTYYAETPVLAKISFCESQYRQFGGDGNVLRGRAVNEDVGVMQINETYHKATAEKLGYNIYTLDGNLAYGQYLYDRQGTQPWSASKACWGK